MRMGVTFHWRYRGDYTLGCSLFLFLILLVARQSRVALGVWEFLASSLSFLLSRWCILKERALSLRLFLESTVTIGIMAQRKEWEPRIRLAYVLVSRHEICSVGCMCTASNSSLFKFKTIWFIARVWLNLGSCTSKTLAHLPTSRF
jgi:hypothetical protein